MDCYKYCEDIQQQYIIINDKILEMERQNAADGGRYSKKQLERYSKLSTEFQKLLLDHQICVEGCKLRTQYSGGDDSKDSTQVDPEILKELNALEEEEEYLGGDRTRSTIRRRNKSKTKRRQTHSTRRRNNRRRRSTRRNRKQ
jgi:hypothetical protein